jgi:hypothetical protein
MTEQTIEVQLRRAFEPNEIGVEEAYGICGSTFILQAVRVHVLRHNLGEVCPTCVEYLGRQNSERFASIEEYEEANAR